jgi:hypothetical protein
MAKWLIKLKTLLNQAAFRAAKTKVIYLLGQSDITMRSLIGSWTGAVSYGVTLCIHQTTIWASIGVSFIWGSISINSKELACCSFV